MLDGAFEHEDNQGHRGIIKPGDLQWMTAGKGIVHAEMPVGKDEGHGLQLWVNLAAKDKMVEPAYQELLSKDIPKVKHDGVTGKRQAFDTPLSPPTLYLPAAPPPPCAASVFIIQLRSLLALPLVSPRQCTRAPLRAT